MTATRTATLTIDCCTLPHTALVTGPGVGRLLNDLGLPWQWDHERRCWLVSAKRVDDLALAARQAGLRVVVRGGLW